MWKKTTIQISLLILVIFLLVFAYKYYFQKTSPITSNKIDTIDNLNPGTMGESGSLITNLRYLSKDEIGNEYLIESEFGELSLKNPDLILMKNVRAKIVTTGADPIHIVSESATYNSLTHETLFETNVTIDYLENKIQGQKLDVSLSDNFATITHNVIYNNLEIKLMADVIEFDIITKNSKIFMYDKNKKVKIINK
jgi:lipopolysaccharide assembly outer membrane protein LptD (OstA)